MSETNWSLIKLEGGGILFAEISQKNAGDKFGSYVTMHFLLGGVLPHCVIEITEVLGVDTVPNTAIYPQNFHGAKIPFYRGKIIGQSDD